MMGTRRRVAAGALGALLLLPLPVSAIHTVNSTFDFFTPGTLLFPSPTRQNLRVLNRHQFLERADLSRHQQRHLRTLQRVQQFERRGVRGAALRALRARQRVERQELTQHNRTERSALSAHQTNEASPFRLTTRPFG